MILLPHYEGKTVFVLGLARTGLATCRALMASGAQVIAWDDNESARAQAEAENIRIIAPEAIIWNDIDRMVMSPGIPSSYPQPHRAVTMAREAGIQPTVDIQLLFETQPNALYIGITGSQGKSTTTSLIGHLLTKAGHNVQVGGNIGKACLELSPFAKTGVYVLELSSYQLELMEMARFNIAVFLNLSENHLDRHGSLENYVAAKMHIFDNQSPQDICVVGIDDPLSAAIYEGLLSQNLQTVFPVSSLHAAPGGVYVKDGALYDDMEQTGHKVGDVTFNPHLKGRHNCQNIAAAYTVARTQGMTPKDIFKHLKTFVGLPHRQEYIGHWGQVLFINDSKATTLEPTARALEAYKNIYWIAGGRPNSSNKKDINEVLPYASHVKKAYLIGEIATFFAELMEDKIEFELSETLENAFHQILREVNPDEPAVVLLSPGCASWDQFKSFEHRGDTFKNLVRDFLTQAGSQASFG